VVEGRARESLVHVVPEAGAVGFPVTRLELVAPLRPIAPQPPVPIPRALRARARACLRSELRGALDARGKVHGSALLELHRERQLLRLEPRHARARLQLRELQQVVRALARRALARRVGPAAHRTPRAVLLSRSPRSALAHAAQGRARGEADREGRSVRPARLTWALGCWFQSPRVPRYSARRCSRGDSKKTCPRAAEQRRLRR